MESLWHKIYKELTESLSSKEFIEIYQEIRSQHLTLYPFASPEELIAFFHDRDRTDYEKRDEILKLLIRQYQKGGSYHLLGCYFFLSFLPGINRIYYRYRGKYPGISNQELIQQIWLICLETIRELNLTAYPRKLPSRVVGTIANRVREWIRQQLEEAKRLAGHTQEELEEIARESYAIEAEGREDPLASFFAQEGQAEKLLAHLVKHKVISEADRLLILDTIIGGRSLVELAKGYGSRNYKQIQKRRERALKAIKKYMNQRWQNDTE